MPNLICASGKHRQKNVSSLCEQIEASHISDESMDPEDQAQKPTAVPFFSTSILDACTPDLGSPSAGGSRMAESGAAGSPALSTDDASGSLKPPTRHVRTWSSKEILASLPLNLIRQWILAFAVINFDLEIGPTIDCIYPDVELTKDEKTTMYANPLRTSNP